MNRRRLLAASLAIGIASCAREPSPADDLATLGRGVDDVQLTAADGSTVHWGDLKGRPRAVFFGFTNCPVICPVTVFELSDALEKLGAPGNNVAIDFITLDPERDTPERLTAYFSPFGARIHAYTGDPEAIRRIGGAFEVIYNRTELEGGDYTIDHTTTVFLLDETGRVVDVIAYGSPAEVIQGRLRALAGAGA